MNHFSYHFALIKHSLFMLFFFTLIQEEKLLEQCFLSFSMLWIFEHLAKACGPSLNNQFCYLEIIFSTLMIFFFMMKIFSWILTFRERLFYLF